MIRLWLVLAICLTACALRFSENHQANLIPDPQLDKLRAIQLEKHNVYRAKHGCQPLKLNAKLNAVAQKYSQTLATRTNKTPKLVHSGSKKYGENLYWGWGYPKLKYVKGAASDSWYSQQSLYTYGVFPPAAGTGHFTAMIWKQVTDVGFGLYKVIEDKGEAIYVVANYSPTPNIWAADKYAINVPKPS